MYKTISFKKKMLATAVASVAAAGFSSAVFAQDNVEEVMVTGIRASLEASMDTKRNSAGVVDSINAEDIGKFPDTNLAESLQRISGVSISRENGEGAKVTVRGFGDGYNMVTLNGRMMPAAGVYGGGSGAGGTFGGATRGFDFGNLASEGVRGVDVYKTGKANVATGGIGATIDLKTTRPLENPGFHATVGGKAVMDTTNRTGSDVTPEVSGLVSWTDDDAMFGASLSVSHQERDSGTSSFAQNKWNIGVWGQDNLYSFTSDAVIENAPANGQLYARPNDIRYSFSDSERNRDNAQLTLQWAPSDDVTTTLDYTYAQNELMERRGESTSWLANNSSIDHVVFDTGNSKIASPLYIHETVGPRDQGYEQQLRQQENTLKSLGFNVDFKATDTLTLNFDVHNSTMDSLPTGPGKAGEIAASIAVPTQMSHWIDYRSDLPQFNMELNDCQPGADGQNARGNCNGMFDAGDVGSQVVRVFYADQTTEITEFRFDGVQEFDNGHFDFGVQTRAMEMNSRASDRYMAMGDWSIKNVGDIPTNLFEEFNLADFDDYSTADTWQGGLKGNAEDIAASLVGTYGTAENGYCVCYNPNFSSNNTVKEDTESAYFQLGMNGQLGGMETNLLVGLRYETTDVESTSQVKRPDYLLWQDDNDFQTHYAADAVLSPETFTASYDNLLPSLDFDIALAEDLKGRFSFSKTIARAGYSDMRASVGDFSAGGGATAVAAKRTATTGNPGILPLESTNFDVSLEWYYNDSSYASVGLFEKRVINFIGNNVITRNVYGILDQTSANSPRVQAAKEALLAGSFPVDNASLFNMMVILDNPDDFPNGAADYTGTLAQQQAIATKYDLAANSDDPLSLFDVSTPSNSRDAKLYGAEFAVQHFFGDTGFGVQANYTIVRGDVSFDDGGDPNVSQFALLGLSDTANLVGIYENDQWQARIAYNWRDEYLSSTNQSGARNPNYVEAYSQIDLTVSYNVMDNLTLSLEGLNVTGENRRDHGRSKTQIEYLLDLGPRYQVGVRYDF